MELDVRLTRTADQQWGFRLIGGTDFGMPLTVVKVVVNSPADMAGLRNGDAVCCINGGEAADMTHEESRVVLAGAGDTLSLKVVRGLYDPVLDDTEPLFEPIDQADFDQPSIPTEVEHLEVPQKLPQYVEPQLPLPDLIDPQLIDRSLTASPFVPQLKPYRPFSTEPVIEIPPLEDPIILNPNYHDEFGRLKNEEDFLPVTKFKLPISEQYDPDGTKQKVLQKETKEEMIAKTQEEIHVKKYEELEMKEQIMTKEEIQFLEEMKKEIDVERIELTATSIVDESIQKALTVAEEINKEIVVELSETTKTTELKSEKETVEVESSTKSEETLSEVKEIVTKESATKEAVQLAELLDKTTEKIVKQSGLSIEDHLQKIEQATTIKEFQKSELKESIEDTENISDTVKTQVSTEKDTVKQNINESSFVDQQESAIQESKTQKRTEQKLLTETIKEESQTEKKYSTAKLLSEQRAYTIGLQTIPNIRGTAHSSYHYDLLLRTFFIHLTDVMVALSRFILAEPVLSKTEGGLKTETTDQIRTNVIDTVHESVKAAKQDVVKKDVVKQDVEKQFVENQDSVKKDIIQQDIIQQDTLKRDKQEVMQVQAKKESVKEKVAQIANVETQEVAEQKVSEAVFEKTQKSEAIVEKEKNLHQEETAKMQFREENVHKHRYDEFDHVNVSDSFLEERKILSGSKMSQRTEKKSDELMQKMEAVITEFESKSGGEDIEVVRERRSRSRSRAEEALHEDVDVSYEEKQLYCQERTSKLLTDDYSSSVVSSSTAQSRIDRQSVYDTVDYQTAQFKEGKNTYVAIVEAHVYTNKDAIFDEQLELETASMQAVTEAKKEVTKTEDVQKEQVVETKVKAEKVVDKAQKLVETKKETKDVEKTVLSEKKDSKKEVLNQFILESSISDVSTVKIEEIKMQVDLKKKNQVEIPKEEYFVSKEIVKEKVEDVIEAIKDIKKDDKKVVIQEIIEPIIENEETISDYHVTEAKDEITAVQKDEVFATEVFASTLVAQEKALIEEVKPKSILKERVETVKETKEVIQDVVTERTDLKEEKSIVVEDKIAIDEEIKTVEQSVIAETTTIEEHVAKEEIATFNEVKAEEFHTAVAVKEESKIEQIEARDQMKDIKDSYIEKKDEAEVIQSHVVIEKENDMSVKDEALSIIQVLEEKESKQEAILVKEEVKSDNTAVLKVMKEEVIEQQRKNIESKEQVNVSYKKEISKFESQVENFESKQTIQESTFVAKSIETKPEKLSLDLPIKESKSTVITEVNNNLETPSPTFVPPTPLTDEYVFKLEIALPKREGDPIPRDCTPSDDEEDPNIVKKGLVAVIDAEIGEQKIFDPPLPTPPVTPGSPRSPKSPQSPRSPTSPKSPKFPVYTKPGLRGGADRDYSKEEILEIERKSSLLASAIDETIKSIEEYKEEVGIKQETAENHNEKGLIYNGYAKVIETKIFNTANQDFVQESKETEEHSLKDKVIMDEVKERKQKSSVINQEITEVQAATDVQENVLTESLINTAIEKIDAKIESTDSKIKNIETKVKFVNSETVNGHTETPVMKEVEDIVKQEMKGVIEDKRDPMEGYKAVHFDPEELLNAQRERRLLNIQVPQMTASQERELYKTESGELIGTRQGIVDGLKEAVVNPEVAKDLGKPGITEEKIAELISGESEMLREAHVMGLTRVLTSHMQKDDDSSVDFKRIKPIVESLKDSEVLKALNEEMMKAHEEKKKEEKKWTTFLQKPKRPVPRGKGGEVEEVKAEPYKVKIVKQPKPKVAPDYKPKNFNTGLLPWEERALREPTPPPVDPEEPILVPEEAPEILEAVDPLPESEVPDLEDSGIPLPPPPLKEPTPLPEDLPEEPQEELDLEAVLEETEKIVEENIAEEMESNNIAEQIMMSVQNMVDPNASLDQQLAQMRAQLAALAQLPGVIQQSLELVTRQLTQLSQMETTQTVLEELKQQEPIVEETQEVTQNGTEVSEETVPQPEPQQVEEPMTVEKSLTPEELEQMRREEEAMLEEQRRMEKQKKEAMEQARIEHESRQVKQHSVPRVGKPKPVFGPATPQERPLVLPGGRRWRKPKDAYNEQFIAETLSAQAEIISGKAKGHPYESVLLPYDKRINFMKYEKPPVSLDHLKDSDVYKLIHNMEQTPARRVDMLTPVMAEEDYREKCRSMTPCPERLAQQVQP